MKKLIILSVMFIMASGCVVQKQDCKVSAATKFIKASENRPCRIEEGIPPCDYGWVIGKERHAEVYGLWIIDGEECWESMNLKAPPMWDKRIFYDVNVFMEATRFTDEDYKKVGRALR